METKPKTTLQARDVLLAFSFRYKGNWHAIYQAIKRHEPLSRDDITEAYRHLKSGFITLTDSNYPPYLREMIYPPFILYYYGDTSYLTYPMRLAAIGTRLPTLYQTDMSYQLIQETEESLDNRLVIVSGMAKGIDSAVMHAAMKKEAPVIAYLGGGVDHCYPQENQDIYDYCRSGKGLILSEYPDATLPKPENFVFRNRLIVQTGLCLYVGGGSHLSGTSASVTAAINAGKEVLALPCNLGEKDMTDQLIHDGATMVIDSRDILDELKSASQAESLRKG